MVLGAFSFTLQKTTFSHFPLLVGPFQSITNSWPKCVQLRTLRSLLSRRLELLLNSIMNFNLCPKVKLQRKTYVRLLFGNVHLLSRFSSFAHPSIHKPPMFIDKVSLFPLPVSDKKCISANGAPATRTISIP